MPRTNDISRLADWEAYLQEKLCPCANTLKIPSPAWLIRCYAQTTSTMDAAREFLDEVTPQRPALVIAQTQTAGRGRRGRRWEQARSGLYLTAVFAAEKPPSHIGAFAPTLGCVLFDFFSAYACPVKIKWPNDMWSIDGRKIAGVLIESACHQNLTHILVGIGINLIGAPASVLHAVSIQELCGVSLTPLKAATHLAPALWRAWRIFIECGFAPFKESWLSHAMFIGEEVKIHTDDAVTAGRVLGIKENGALLLEKDGNVIEIISGDVLVQV